MAGSDRPPLTVALYAAESDWEDISDIDALKEGDFVFFYGTDNAEVAHMGIVVDDTYMIDASSSEGKVVKREYKTRYWEEHFAGGKRPW